jgi:chromosome segregation ATPase
MLQEQNATLRQENERLREELKESDMYIEKLQKDLGVAHVSIGREMNRNIKLKADLEEARDSNSGYKQIIKRMKTEAKDAAWLIQRLNDKLKAANERIAKCDYCGFTTSEGHDPACKYSQ